MSDDSDIRGDRDGLLDAIRSAIETLVAAENGRRSHFEGEGEIPRDRFAVEYSFTGSFGGLRPETDGQSSSRSADHSDYRVDARQVGDDELLVVADLPDVDGLTVGLDEDGRELVLAIDDEVVERMTFSQPVEVLAGQFRHGVLELRFRTEGRKQ